VFLVAALLSVSAACGEGETATGPATVTSSTMVVTTSTSTTVPATTTTTTTTTTTPPRLRAGDGVSSPPEWWPLRGSNLIGCARRGGGGVCSGRHHPVWAIDIEGPEGQLVYPSGAGFATIKDDSTGCSGYGRAVVVDHGGGVTSLYAHLDDFVLDFSDGGVWVDTATPIGTIGHTGNVSRCSYTHLHYEESTTGSYDDGASDPGPMLACVGGEAWSYPEAWGATSWSGLMGHAITATSEGTDC